jgi:hypothetical protein
MIQVCFERVDDGSIAVDIKVGFDIDTGTIRLLTYINNGKMAIWDFDKEKKVISKEHKYDDLSLTVVDGNIITLQNHPTQADVFLAISTKTAIVRHHASLLHIFLIHGTLMFSIDIPNQQDRSCPTYNP